ncbi:hypothetical protein BKA82DRAFT_16737 [Pisolithus tinctorius]|uniref:MYND-type domain-containing protein n=1 Tax=Pisolithus tinctorius Marx 270 TaxID=870435 RepID=A0A0C3NQY7_PISTI|nr:hypothetical protein BKA82DRAFT_16737 [Pisolithus tinctorius]KIN97728.1 hypothetical protein M404DRAFT_16737 [Pisolithus tinctorius Marx 270]
MPVVLQAHPTARDTAVSETRVSAGTVLVAVPCLAQVLLGAEKGRRCDCCLTPEEADLRLRRCSGCGSYWYCDAQCQRAHWPAHKKYCSNFARYTSSPAFAQLQTHQKLDAVLLTHLLAEFAATDTSSEELATFASLLPGPVSGLSCPPTCPLTTSRKSSHSASELYRRCGNNNFAIHSHFTTIAHGIFPLASRLFNHSCLPNAFPKYTFDRQHRVQMSIVAMRDIEAGEEICISYVDPALLDTRQQIFQFTYGFTCTCPSCTALSIIRRTASPPPISEADITSLSTRLVNHVFPRLSSSDLSIALPSTLPSLATLPPSLHVALHESFLTHLTDRFSSASHEGPFDVALESGLAVLALYVLIYPPNYPQIGLHLLELSKTAWNAHVTSPDLGPSTFITDPVHYARVCLDLAQQVLRIVGPEGDPGGPAKELEVLAGLLSGGDT